MPEFQVEIANTRTDYLLVTVTAETADEAKEAALTEMFEDDDFYGKKWDEGPSEYTATVVTAPALVSDTN